MVTQTETFMTEIWYEDELVPSENWLDTLKLTKSPMNSAYLENPPKGIIRLHMPQELHLTASDKIQFRRSGYKYVLVRLGCEFDPGEEARSANFGFISAKFSIPIFGEGDNFPRVHSLFPLELNRGKPDTAKIKFEPAITLISGASVSLGSIEKDIAFGQVAPIVRGFKGDDEHAPYWNLEHHREAPLYGLRHFWMLLEIPPTIENCYLMPVAEAELQGKIGPILLKSRKQEAHRPRYKIVL
jgi:hypothetical protein